MSKQGTVPALRCRVCGSIRIVASSRESATRMREALGPREFRLVELPAAEARVTKSCKHHKKNTVNNREEPIAK